MEITVSAEQLDDIRHALGWSHTPNLSKLGWRNYYFTNEPIVHLDDLVVKGLMTRNGFVYRVTLKGGKLIGMPRKRLVQVWPEVKDA